MSFFAFGDTLAQPDRRAVPGRAERGSRRASLIYLAFILLVFALVVNVAAQVIVKRFELKQGVVRDERRHPGPGRAGCSRRGTSAGASA